MGTQPPAWPTPNSPHSHNLHLTLIPSTDLPPQREAAQTPVTIPLSITAALKRKAVALWPNILKARRRVLDNYFAKIDKAGLDIIDKTLSIEARDWLLSVLPEGPCEEFGVEHANTVDRGSADAEWAIRRGTHQAKRTHSLPYVLKLPVVATRTCHRCHLCDCHTHMTASPQCPSEMGFQPCRKWASGPDQHETAPAPASAENTAARKPQPKEQGPPYPAPGTTRRPHTRTGPMTLALALQGAGTDGSTEGSQQATKFIVATIHSHVQEAVRHAVSAAIATELEDMRDMREEQRAMNRKLDRLLGALPDP